jgi:putative transposase
VDASEAVYVVAGDDVIGTKAGLRTHGLDRFCASWYGKPVPGWAVFALALVRVQERRSFPRRVEPVVRREAAKAASQAKAAAKQPKAPCAKRQPGRPKGRPNHPPTPGPLTPALVRLTALLTAWLHLVATVRAVTDVVLDGHFGNPNALAMARQCGWHLSAKLRGDAALSFPSVGPDAGRGPRRQYGAKVADDHLPEPDSAETTLAGHLQTRWSQMPLLHKECAQPLHVVSIVQTNRRTQARAQVLLFSSDLTLAAALLVDD